MTKLRFLITVSISFYISAQPVYSRTSGNASNCNDGKCNWYDAMAYCKTRGSSLPTVKELLKRYHVECNVDVQPITCGNKYWSSAESSASNARCVEFITGENCDAAKYSDDISIQCVNNKSSLKDSRLKKGKNGKKAKRTGVPANEPEATVKQKSGNAANCNNGYCNWYDAMAYCKGRLPTVHELRIMHQDECIRGRKLDLCDNWYWSSESDGASSARGVYFQRDSVYTDSKEKDAVYGNTARCAQTISADNQKTENAVNCRDSQCNWHDAMTYCKGRLPTVTELLSMYKVECTGEKKADTCIHWYWSSEEHGVFQVRCVNFRDGTVISDDEDTPHFDGVRCAP